VVYCHRAVLARTLGAVRVAASLVAPAVSRQFGVLGNRDRASLLVGQKRSGVVQNPPQLVCQGRILNQQAPKPSLPVGYQLRLDGLVSGIPVGQQYLTRFLQLGFDSVGLFRTGPPPHCRPLQVR
jgi:hypothetical protein